jgi:hypothetical protein
LSRTRSLRVLGLVLALFTVLVVAACGDEKTNNYVDDANDVLTTLQADAKKATQGDTSSPEGIKKQLTQLSADVKKAADGFEALEPPDDVKADHQKLIDTLRKSATSLDDGVKALDQGDVAAIQTANTEFQKGITESQQILDQIKKKVED